MSSLLLPLAASGATSVASADAAPLGESRSLVAYFSRSGNTRVIAGLLSRTLPADLFEVAPATPYPADYSATVEQARQERDRGDRPPLKESLPGIAAYATVFLGFPIWGETAPPVIRSFLVAHDLAGKTVIPFITHGGYGLGNSLAVVASHAPRASLAEGFSMQAPQERQTVERVTRWLDTLSVK
nr:flavodoxin [Mesorhizobium hawassense]